MANTRITTTRTLSAEFSGRAWGGFDATQDVTATLKRGPLAPQLADIKRRKGGDFQSEGLALVGTITLTRRRIVSGSHSVRVVERSRLLPIEA